LAEEHEWLKFEKGIEYEAFLVQRKNVNLGMKIKDNSKRLQSSLLTILGKIQKASFIPRQG
jgi:hypothetical protein